MKSTENDSGSGTPRAEDIGTPVFWEPSLAFMKYAIAFILAGCVMFVIVMRILAPDQTARAMAAVGFMIVAASAWILIARHRRNAAILTLGIGTWVYVTAASTFFGGASGTSIIIYPLIILLVGWLVSTRAAAAVALMTVAATGGFVFAELAGVLPAAVATPPVARWIIQCGVFIISAVLITLLVRSYRRRLEELGALGDKLEQRTAELQAREADLNNAQTIAHVGSWVYDMVADVMHLSGETCNIFGLPKEVKGSHDTYLSRVHPDDRDRVDGEWQQAVRKGTPFDSEHRILVGDSIRWVRQKAEIKYGGDGAPLRSVGITQDITERKQAEEALGESKALTDAVVENVPLMIFLKEATDLRFVILNRAGEELLGYDRKDLLGKNNLDLFPPEQSAHFMAKDREVLDGDVGVLDIPEECILTAGKGQRLLHTRKVSIRGRDGKTKYLLGISEDITERKRTEEQKAQLEAQLRESQKMEALGTLAGGVAHDFNNALAVILGNLELARKDIGPGHAAQVSLEEIGKAGQRAKDLVRQILAFSRRQQVERKVISLAPVIHETARLVRATLPAMVNLSVKCDRDAPAVLADSSQIEQILLNLCSNAAHAVHDRGRPGAIAIRLNTCDILPGEARSGLRAGHYACLTVRDNGSGMDEATRMRIFEPFFTTKSVNRGTGLGLSVVYTMVQAHDASIEVESTPGEGSIFHIFFPAADAQVEEDVAPKSDAAPVDGAGKRVLYVDDEEAIIFLVRRLLERQGYRVSGFTKPEEALAAVRANPGLYSIAVTDYSMPGMSGLEVATALKEIRADLPVIMASGYITDELRQKALAAGVRELIYKPNTVEDLCEAVKHFASEQGGD